MKNSHFKAEICHFVCVACLGKINL